MQNLEDLRRWLSNGISDPFMLHATSSESILELTNSGKLPTGVFDTLDPYVNDPVEGRLFFVPISSKFKGKKYKGLNMTRSECFEDAKFYASTLAPVHYLANKLNCKTAETYQLLKSLERGDIGWDHAINGLRKDGIYVSKRQIIALYDVSKKRKGVILEPEKSILSLSNEAICHDIVSVECPEGLDKKYISGIELLGPVEEGLMKRFLDSKLKYEGFKTEKPLVY
jgi:hypothetical protein